MCVLERCEEQVAVVAYSQRFLDLFFFLSKARFYLTKQYLLIIFRKSTPPQKRQLIVHYYQLKYQVDGFVGELNF